MYPFGILHRVSFHRISVTAPLWMLHVGEWLKNYYQPWWQHLWFNYIVYMELKIFEIKYLYFRCITTNQLGVMLFLFDPHEWGVGIELPKFESSSEVYLLCSIRLCDSIVDGKTDKCDRSCNSSNFVPDFGHNPSTTESLRRRRQLLQKNNLDQHGGPFIIRDFDVGPMIKDSGELVYHSTSSNTTFVCYNCGLDAGYCIIYTILRSIIAILL